MALPFLIFIFSRGANMALTRSETNMCMVDVNQHMTPVAMRLSVRRLIITTHYQIHCSEATAITNVACKMTRETFRDASIRRHVLITGRMVQFTGDIPCHDRSMCEVQFCVQGISVSTPYIRTIVAEVSSTNSFVDMILIHCFQDTSYDTSTRDIYPSPPYQISPLGCLIQHHSH